MGNYSTNGSSNGNGASTASRETCKFCGKIFAPKEEGLVNGNCFKHVVELSRTTDTCFPPLSIRSTNFDLQEFINKTEVNVITAGLDHPRSERTIDELHSYLKRIGLVSMSPFPKKQEQELLV